MSYKGKINAYVCEQCRHETVTIDRDEGVTPFMIRCEKCPGLAQSRMYRVDQSLTPTHEWYKPTEDEAKAADEKAPGMLHHAQMGGLFRRPLEGQSTNEKQTCRSRMEQAGPWDRVEGIDEWRNEQWGQRESDRWPEGFPMPRTCSFCGGAHPDDVLELMRQGWEVDGTRKPYKRYLNPPGYWAQTFGTIDRMRTGESEGEPTRIVAPTPPVKVYLWHFEKHHVDAFNALLPKKVT